ncbi:MAG: 3'-5' exonuclease [Treponema sp.]|nr:3'-5' exonuclease [Treponema sp.]
MAALFKSFRHLAQEFYSGKTFVAFDTETTGLKAETGFVIEIGAVKFSCGSTAFQPFDILIKPPVQLSEFITNLTHITSTMLCGCPCAKEALPEFLDFVGGSETVLVAHNAPFDLGFINSELRRSSMPEMQNTCIDTLQASLWAYPELKNESEKGQYRLQSLAKRFSIPVEAAHRANDDARVCMELFRRILSDTENRQAGFQRSSMLQKWLFT